MKNLCGICRGHDQLVNIFVSEIVWQPTMTGKSLGMFHYFLDCLVYNVHVSSCIMYLMYHFIFASCLQKGH